MRGKLLVAKAAHQGHNPEDGKRKADREAFRKAIPTSLVDFGATLEAFSFDIEPISCLVMGRPRPDPVRTA